VNLGILQQCVFAVKVTVNVTENIDIFHWCMGFQIGIKFGVGFEFSARSDLSQVHSSELNVLEHFCL